MKILVCTIRPQMTLTGLMCTNYFSHVLQLVPARSCLNMSAAFTPIIPNLSAESGTDCTGYALGYMSLDKPETCHVPGEVKRGQGLEIAPLRLDFSAYIKPAL